MYVLTIALPLNFVPIKSLHLHGDPSPWLRLDGRMAGWRGGYPPRLQNKQTPWTWHMILGYCLPHIFNSQPQGIIKPHWWALHIHHILRVCYSFCMGIWWRVIIPFFLSSLTFPCYCMLILVDSSSNKVFLCGVWGPGLHGSMPHMLRNHLIMSLLSRSWSCPLTSSGNRR